MQRHGGSNRSLPRTVQPKSVPIQPALPKAPTDPSVTETADRADAGPSARAGHPAG
jgi:hypothetical protein